MNPSTAYLLYGMIALGGMGLYLLLPRGAETRTAAGTLLGAAGALGLLFVLAVRIATPSGSAWWSYLFAAIAILAASRVITHKKPVYSAIYFVLVVVAVAALLILQHAEFLAVALIIIYAGAILVTYLFVIMLAQAPGSPMYDVRAREPFLAVVAAFVLLAGIVGRAEELPRSTRGVGVTVDFSEPAQTAAQGNEHAHALAEVGNTAALGAVIMTRYLVVLEMSGVLLLISMIGAIGLSRKRVPTEGVTAAPRELGQVGREVAPY